MKKKNLYTAITLLFLALFIYVFCRAHLLSFTCDESLTYSILKGNPTWVKSANNHLLNTFLMELSSAIFGYGELALRLPNVLAFLVYAFFCYLFLMRLKNWYFLSFGIALFILNPFLLEFFSLARGYGLAIGFIMGCLYYFTRRNLQEYTYKTFTKDFLLAMLFGTLAVLSNLAAINVYMGILSIFTLQYILFVKNNKPANLKIHLPFIAAFIGACIPILLTITRLSMLAKLNQLYAGKTDLIWLLNGLIESSYYLKYYSPLVRDFIEYILLVLFCSAIALVLFKKIIHNSLFKVTSLVILILLSLIAERYLFDALYPPERTATVFMPIIGLMIYEVFACFNQQFASKRHNRFFMLLLSIFTVLIINNFIYSLNLTHSISWKYDAHTKEVMNSINEQLSKPQKSIYIGNHWLFTPTINYYIDKNKMTYMEPAIMDSVNHKADFIYEFDNNKFDTTNFVKLAEFIDIGTTFYKNKNLILVGVSKK